MAIQNVIISEYDLNSIKMGFGFPVIQNEAQNLMTDDQIKSYVIAPALEIFFSYFPIESFQDITVGGYGVTTVDYPSNFVCVADCRFIPQVASIGGGYRYNISDNPFFSASQVVSKGGGASVFGGGMFGSPFNYGYKNTYFERRMAADSADNMNRVWKATQKDSIKKLELYNSIPGVISITWGLYTENFEDACQLHRRSDLISLCRNMYKQQLGNILTLQNQELPTSIDAEALKSEAYDEIEKLREKWSDQVKVISLR
jgi:hypothetical protein